MKRYKVLKDWNGSKAGEVVLLADDVAQVALTAGNVEKLADDTDPIKLAVEAATKELKDNMRGIVTLFLADALKTVEVDGKQVKVSDILVGRDRRELDPAGGYINLGEFAHDVRTFNGGKGMSERLKVIATTKAPTGLNEGVGEDGGLLIPPTFAAGIWKRAADADPILGLVDMLPITGNTLTFLQEKGDTKAAGVRNAGVRGYWVEEGGQGTASRPQFRHQTLRLRKQMVLVYSTDELLEDSPTALAAFLTQKAGDEIGFMTGDAIINGDGVGKPLGILNSAGVVSVAKESGQAAATVVAENIVKMFSRCWAPSRRNAVWVYNQDVEPQLLTLNVGVGAAGILVYMPPGGLSAAPYGTLLGRRMEASEFAATVGSTGDLLLADFSQYQMIQKVGGIKSAVSIHLRFDYDETVFKFTYRVDGQPKWPAALTPYKSAATLSPFVKLDARA